jgi:hypothetical protein
MLLVGERPLPAAEQAIAVDRCARAIGAILADGRQRARGN